MQLVADGQALLPPDPDFIQARDGIIQADFVDTGGANFREIWAGFAKRGMGFSASAPNSLQTVGVHEAFDAPDDLWIIPRTDWLAKGRTGGPFEPRTGSFSLETVTSPSVTGSAWATVPWRSV